MAFVVPERDGIAVVRDPDTGELIGFQITLGPEQVSALMPVDGIPAPYEIAKEIRERPALFVRKHGNRMIRTARERFHSGQWQEQGEYEAWKQRQEEADFTPEQLAVLRALNPEVGGA